MSDPSGEPTEPIDINSLEGPVVGRVLFHTMSFPDFEDAVTLDEIRAHIVKDLAVRNRFEQVLTLEIDFENPITEEEFFDSLLNDEL